MAGVRWPDYRAAETSPILHLPKKSAPVVLAYGTGELPELQRQSVAYHDRRHHAFALAGDRPDQFATQHFVIHIAEVVREVDADGKGVDVHRSVESVPVRSIKTLAMA